MREPNFVHKYNAKVLAEKDPFEINQIKCLADFDRVDYYAGLVSSFVQELLEKSIGYDSLQHRSLGGVVKSLYFFDGKEEPRVEQWSAFKDTKIEEKGDVVVKIFDNDTYIDGNLRRLFEILKVIEGHNYEVIDESKISGVRPLIKFEDELINLFYYEKDNEKYFVFEFTHEKGQRKVVKKLI